MVVSADYHGRSARPVHNAKPATFGEFTDEWWCESEFGDTVLVTCCKSSYTAAEEAAAYFSSLAVDGPLDALEVLVESWEAQQILYTIHRETRWRARACPMASTRETQSDPDQWPPGYEDCPIFQEATKARKTQPKPDSDP
ncbi:MAG: hypothetical protein ACYSWU_28790 [Planctomycetota bacterium]|jgi:hypothetical protein